LKKPSRAVSLTLALVLTVAVPPAVVALMGGWATITVEDLPDYAVAGEPLNLRFTIRQHGEELMSDLRPTVEAKSGLVGASAVARPSSKGVYVATITPPDAGEWTVTIHSGLGTSKLTLLPIQAIPRGAAVPPPLSDPDRGRRLFVAKGCVGCHMRNEAGLAMGESIGPELTGKRYQADFLRRFLTDPAANPTRTGTFRMPNLALKPAEIASLVAFINSDRSAGN